MSKYGSGWAHSMNVTQHNILWQYEDETRWDPALNRCWCSSLYDQDLKEVRSVAKPNTMKFNYKHILQILWLEARTDKLYSYQHHIKHAWKYIFPEDFFYHESYEVKQEVTLIILIGTSYESVTIQQFWEQCGVRDLYRFVHNSRTSFGNHSKHLTNEEKCVILIQHMWNSELQPSFKNQ